MSGYVPAIIFFTLFIGAAIFIIIASSAQRRQWAKRPAVLRDFASRRGYQFVENPGEPGDLAPLRPYAKRDNIRKVELPAAVRGRTLDNQFTLFDVYTQTVSHAGSRSTYYDSYETFITFKSPGRVFPYFEFACLAHVASDSMTGKLLEMVASATESLMQDRGLTRVPVEGQPGFQLYVHDVDKGSAIRDTAVRALGDRTGWWIGAKDDAVTVVRMAQRSSAMATLVPDTELEAFVNDATQIERGLRALSIAE